MIPLQHILLRMQLLLLAQEQHTYNVNRMWQLPLIRERHYSRKGFYDNLFEELRNDINPAYCHHDYFRMSKYTFDYILEKIRHRQVPKITGR